MISIPADQNEGVADGSWLYKSLFLFFASCIKFLSRGVKKTLPINIVITLVRCTLLESMEVLNTAQQGGLPPPSTCHTALCNQVGFVLAGDDSARYERQAWWGCTVITQRTQNRAHVGFEYSQASYSSPVSLAFSYPPPSHSSHTAAFSRSFFFGFTDSCHPSLSASLVTASVSFSVPQWETLPSLSFSL